MADVRVILRLLNGNSIEAKKIKSFELDRDMDAPCDALRLTFISEKSLDEIVSAQVSIDGKKVFFGYVDTQREELTQNGRISFIYARSSSCILTDIEARPTALYYPSAKALFKLYIEKYGFTFDIDDVFGQGPYIVSKGTSLFGLLNKFMFSTTGRNIYVTPDNEIKLFESENDLVLPGNSCYEKKTINRGNAIAYINYKVASADEYNRYYEDKTISGKGITHLVVKNFSSVPSWQVQKTLSEIMEKANRNYITYEIRFNQFISAELCDRVCLRMKTGEIPQGAHVSGITYIFNENGVQTRLKLLKENHSEGINYVDK